MRLFECEAYFIREMAYSSFMEYRRLWDYIASLNSEEDLDCPEATRAYIRCTNLMAWADLIDPQGRYNFYTRYRDERNNASTARITPPIEH